RRRVRRNERARAREGMGEEDREPVEGADCPGRVRRADGTHGTRDRFRRDRGGAHFREPAFPHQTALRARRARERRRAAAARIIAGELAVTEDFLIVSVVFGVLGLVLFPLARAW